MGKRKLFLVNLGFFIFFVGFVAFNFYSKASNTAIAPRVPNNYLLPELRVLFPDILFIQQSPYTGKREIRFNSKVINVGKGALEMKSAYDKKQKKTKAIQIIHKKDGTITEKVVGYFMFHPTHNHWHFEDFIEFELYTYKKDKSLDELVLTTGKITSCIFDSYVFTPRTPKTPNTPRFPNCKSGRQGISIGWVDNYGPGVPGQFLDIENVPDGNYVLQITVDPSRIILEENEDNNSSRAYIEIKGMDINVISNP